MENTYDHDDYNKPSRLQMAGFALRVAAILIDSLIIFGILMIFVGTALPVLFMSTSIGEIGESAALGLLLAYFFGVPMLFILYQAAFECSKFQGTPGKMAVGIKVTDMDGNKVSFLRAVGRNASKIISSTIFFIGYLMAIWTDKKQGLHDMIASTLVIKKN